ncbi:MAG: hypothetical protein KAR23_03390, partial [Candidatus Aenigmarchaeota archaeon]|nr:hypothetical protein [Candidatus Aenigmarchaeota archaeon]
IDVSWGILTGKLSSSAGSLADRSLGIAALNQTTHHNYYEPESLVFTRSSAFAPLEQAYQAAATFIRNALNAAGTGSLYTGSAASNINLFNRLDNFDDSNIIYFAGGGRNDKLYRNSSDTSDIFNDYNICPFINTLETTIECRDTGIFTSFKNRLVFFSTSDYFARISSNDTNVSSWDLNNGADEDWISDESLIVQMLHNSPSENGPVAFIGHTSVTWLTSEHLAKIFFLRLLEGMDIGSALSSAKNAAILNKENIQDTTAKDFLSYLESSLVLYGIPQIGSNNEIGYIDYTTQNLVQVDANPSTGEDIQWNSTILISPKSDITPLYSGGLWRSTHGNVWYYNVTEPSADKINITFVASLAGEYIPDSTAYNLNVSSDNVDSVNLTLMTVGVERTEISPSSFSEQYNQSTTYIEAAQITDDDLKYAVKSNKSLMLAILYSPNSTLLS